MKMNQHNAVVSENLGKDVAFKVSSNSGLFRNLSTSVYKNKVLAVCREYISNALDIHMDTEQTRPIKITCPTINHPVLEIQDFGTGLREDQIVDIYITYGESTKQNDENQIGGFGIGSKSAFAYTNNFTVRSVVDGIATLYSFRVGDDFIPKMNLISCHEVDEENGVKVSVPVFKNDIIQFENEIQAVLSFHNPDLYEVNLDTSYVLNTDDMLGEFGNAALVNGSEYSYASRISIIVGGVRYFVDYTRDIELPSEAIAKLHTLRKYCTPYFSFGASDISVALSRESIQLDRPSKARLVDTLLNFTNSFNDYATALIAKKCDGVEDEVERITYVNFINRLFKQSTLESYVPEMRKRFVDAWAYFRAENLSFRGAYIGVSDYGWRRNYARVMPMRWANVTANYLDNALKNSSWMDFEQTLENVSLGVFSSAKIKQPLVESIKNFKNSVHLIHTTPEEGLKVAEDLQAILGIPIKHREVVTAAKNPGQRKRNDFTSGYFQPSLGGTQSHDLEYYRMDPEGLAEKLAASNPKLIADENAKITIFVGRDAMWNHRTFDSTFLKADVLTDDYAALDIASTAINDRRLKQFIAALEDLGYEVVIEDLDAKSVKPINHFVERFKALRTYSWMKDNMLSWETTEDKIIQLLDTIGVTLDKPTLQQARSLNRHSFIRILGTEKTSMMDIRIEKALEKNKKKIIKKLSCVSAQNLLSLFDESFVFDELSKEKSSFNTLIEEIKNVS